jgi:hypothetical protein
MRALAKIHVEALADCPFSMADEYAASYLERAERGGRDAEIRLPGPWSPRRRVTMRHAIHIDLTEHGRAHDEIALRWSSGSPVLPDFHGTVRFRIAGARTRVILEGEYVPPGGRFGVVFDALVGRRLARAALRDFARHLGEELGRRERAWSNEQEGVPATPR